jgi:hypothetical protein
MTVDVEMADASGPSHEKKERDEGPKQPDLLDVLRDNLKLISKAVANREARLIFGRVLRRTASVRSQFAEELLHAFFDETLHATSPMRQIVVYEVSGNKLVRICTLRPFMIFQDIPSLDSTVHVVNGVMSSHPYLLLAV